MRPISLIVFAALAAACHSSSDKRACVSPRDCQGVERCVAGFCEQTDGGTAASLLGEGCTSDSDCASGLGCLVTGQGFPGGLCSRACNAAACPSASVCTDVRNTQAGVSACMHGCKTDDDCRQGYACCTAFQGGGACLPAAFCPSQTLGTSPDLGDSCSGPTCASGETCQGGNPFPGGACTRGCVIGNASTCPTNGRCVDTDTGAFCLQTCSLPTDCRAGYDCAADPTSTAKVCRAKPTVCVAGALFDGQPPRACAIGDMPPLVVGNGGNPVGPSAPPTGCQKTVRCAALPAAQMKVFGVHTAGETVEFDVPAGTAGVTILSQAVSANETVIFKGQTIDNTVVPDKVKTPSGAVLWDESLSIAAGDVLPAMDAYYGGGSPVAGAFTLPNTTKLLQSSSAAGLPSGKWTFKVNDYALECVGDPNCTFGANGTNRYDLQVLIKPGPLPAKGAIDVGFYIVAGNGLTAQTAVTNVKVQRMVQTLSTIYGRAGLCLGTVTFYNLPAWAEAKYATGIDADKTGPCDDLDQMFTLSQPGNTLNFFLVQDIKSTSANGSVVGIDGTIPGPSGVGGTVHSGAAVSIANLNFGTCGSSFNLLCGADEVAYIAAHEGGHWLGLFHTSESGGDAYDTVSDTGICQCNSTCVGATRAAKCGSAGGTAPTAVLATDCRQASTTSCTGADDLMFWQLDTRSLGNLSTQQGQIMRANPLVR